MQDLPVVLDDLHGDAELARDTPGATVIDLLRRRIIDRIDQSQGCPPARPRLPLPRARPVAMPHMLKLVAQGAACLDWGEFLVQDDAIVWPVVDTANTGRQFLPGDMHAKTCGLRFERRELNRYRIGYRIRYDTH